MHILLLKQPIVSVAFEKIKVSIIESFRHESYFVFFLRLSIQVVRFCSNQTSNRIHSKLPGSVSITVRETLDGVSNLSVGSFVIIDGF